MSLVFTFGPKPQLKFGPSRTIIPDHREILVVMILVHRVILVVIILGSKETLIVLILAHREILEVISSKYVRK